MKPPFQLNQAVFDDLIKTHLPQDSTINGVELATRFNSLCLLVKHTLSAEAFAEEDLIYKNRILCIRLIQDEQDEGAAISSYADTEGLN